MWLTMSNAGEGGIKPAGENKPLGAPRGKRPRIRVSCVDQLGACRCHHGHKPGDVFDFDRDRGKMCYGLPCGLSLYRYLALWRNRAWKRARHGKVLLPRSRYAERLACRDRRRVVERNVTKGQSLCHIRRGCPFFLLIILNLCISSDFRF